MERTTVRSSNIDSIGYDEDNETLEVEFNKGGVYQYSNVPLAIYEELINAGSIGVYFAANVKNKYQCIKK